MPLSPDQINKAIAETLSAPDGSGGDELPGEAQEAAEQPAAAKPSKAQEEKPAEVALDTEALAAAEAAGDRDALVQALGPKLTELLVGNKAHAALRLELKQIKAERATADRQIAQAQALATKLQETYGDPVEARKAAEAGNVDAFTDMIEKWAGADWPTVQAWLIKGAAGRPERLASRQKEQAQASAAKEQERTKAITQAKEWVGGELQKLDKGLAAVPGVTDMVFEAMRAGYSKGVNTPKAALPAVRAQLEAQYKALHSLFGKTAAPATKKKDDPPPRGGNGGSGTRTRRLTVEEAIQETLRELGE